MAGSGRELGCGNGQYRRRKKHFGGRAPQEIEAACTQDLRFDSMFAARANRNAPIRRRGLGREHDESAKSGWNYGGGRSFASLDERVTRRSRGCSGGGGSPGTNCVGSFAHQMRKSLRTLEARSAHVGRNDGRAGRGRQCSEKTRKRRAEPHTRVARTRHRPARPQGVVGSLHATAITRGAWRQPPRTAEQHGRCEQQKS